MAAATAQFYFRFRIGCRPTLQNVSLSANQTSECLNPRLRYNYFRFRKTSIHHIVFFFRFQFRPYDRNWHVILHQAAKFHLNRTILSIVMNLWCYIDFQDDGRYGAILLPVSDWVTSVFSECQSLSANQTSSECLNQRLRYNYFRFRKTNVRHIGILLPVSINKLYY